MTKLPLAKSQYQQKRENFRMKKIRVGLTLVDQQLEKLDQRLIKPLVISHQDNNLQEFKTQTQLSKMGNLGQEILER